MLRPATPADTPAIVAVSNTHSRAVLGTDRALIDETRMLRLARYVPPSAVWMLAEVDGVVAGWQHERRCPNPARVEPCGSHLRFSIGRGRRRSATHAP
ncbi:MAG: hypothetical protein M3380_16375 [Chloroflexota bacterium]|nr:hypothetical protein [Chloroflexota bacterium]